ncbi:MAG: hypothetical protein ACI959_000188 [Limisphaerales bacterium]|jgi:hypothetical protein
MSENNNLNPDEDAVSAVPQDLDTENTDEGPSSWLFGFIASVFSCGLLALGLQLTGSASSASMVGPVYLIPSGVIIAACTIFIFKYQQGANAFNSLLRGVLLIALLTGLLSGFFHTGWYRYISPEMVENKLEVIANQMLEDGYSDGDIKESVHRMRVAFTGTMGAFVSGLLWMMFGAFPSIFIIFLSRRT